MIKKIKFVSCRYPNINIIPQISNSRRWTWNLPHKFHLYLIIWYLNHKLNCIISTCDIYWQYCFFWVNLLMILKFRYKSIRHRNLIHKSESPALSLKTWIFHNFFNVSFNFCHLGPANWKWPSLGSTKPFCCWNIFKGNI